MTGPAQNALYAALFGDPQTEALFSAEAELAAMARVEAALAIAQSQLGVIPADAGPAIAAACTALRIDPQDLAQATARNGVPVPGLIAAIRDQMGRTPHAAHLHWGATSQDIMDSALALRIGPMLALWEGRLHAVLTRLAGLAADHADLLMAARTYGQAATPTGFGAVVAGWGWRLLDQEQAMPALRDRVLRVSLSGAAGTLSAMGPQGPAVRQAMARALHLCDPGRSWHSDRSGPGHLADWIAGLAAALGKLAEDLLMMTQSGIGTVVIAGGGASSTMPQKRNPVGPSAMVALARPAMGLAATVRAAGLRRRQRDGAASSTEWPTLPPLCVAGGTLLRTADDVLARLTPDATAMARDLQTGHGTIHAEALTFALTEHTALDRATAAARVADLCAQALREGRDLTELARGAWPGPDWPALIRARSLGQAPLEARAFDSAVRAASGAAVLDAGHVGAVPAPL